MNDYFLFAWFKFIEIWSQYYTVCLLIINYIDFIKIKIIYSDV